MSIREVDHEGPSEDQERFSFVIADTEWGAPTVATDYFAHEVKRRDPNKSERFKSMTPLGHLVA